MFEFQWIRDKLSSSVQFASETYSQVKSKVNYFWGSELRKNANARFHETWQSFKIPFDFHTFSFLAKAPDSKNIFTKSLFANLISYLGSAVSYHVLSKELIHATVEARRQPLVEKTFEMLAQPYLIRSTLNMGLYNIFETSYLNRSLSKYLPSNTKVCNAEKVLKGNIEEIANFVAKLLTAKFANALLPRPINVIASTLIEALTLGENFLSYRLNDLCFKHRYEIIPKNKTYSLGLGLSFLSSLYLLQNLIKYTTGFDNYIVYNALFVSLYQYWMVAARTDTKELSTQGKASDCFFYSKVALKDLLNNTADLVIENLPKTEGKMDWPQLKATLLNYKSKIEASPLFAIPRQIFLPEELRSFQRFAKLEPAQYWFNLLQAKLNWLMKLRSHAVLYYVPGFVLTKKSRIALEILLADSMGDLLKDVNNAISDARFKTISHKQKEQLIPLIKAMNQKKQLKIIQKYSVDDENERENLLDSPVSSATEEDKAVIPMIENTPQTIKPPECNDEASSSTLLPAESVFQDIEEECPKGKRSLLKKYGIFLPIHEKLTESRPKTALPPPRW